MVDYLAISLCRSVITGLFHTIDIFTTVVCTRTGNSLGKVDSRVPTLPAEYLAISL